MYEFRDYAKKVNDNQDKPIKEIGFDLRAPNGLLMLNGEQELGGAKTILCGGAARGGSTMLPYIMRSLGVPIGNVRSENLEDHDILVNRQSATRLTEVIAKRNAEYDTWAFKLVGLRRGQYKFFEEALRNPLFLFIFRNPFDVSAAMVRHSKSDVFSEDAKGFASALQGTLQAYQEFTFFMRQTQRPCVLVSKEHLERSPAPVIEALAKIAGVAVDQEKLDAIVGELKRPGFKRGTGS